MTIQNKLMNTEMLLSKYGEHEETQLSQRLGFVTGQILMLAGFWHWISVT
jgi:hypothetical protein